MDDLMPRHRRRLRAIARGPRPYGASDVLNRTLERRGLIVRTGRDLGPNRREYAVTAGGREACAGRGAGRPTTSGDGRAGRSRIGRMTAQARLTALGQAVVVVGCARLLAGLGVAQPEVKVLVAAVIAGAVTYLRPRTTAGDGAG